MIGFWLDFSLAFLGSVGRTFASSALSAEAILRTALIFSLTLSVSELLSTL